MLGSRALAQTMRPAKLNCRTSSQVKLIGVQRGRSTNSSDSSSLRDVRSSTTLITKSRGAAISSRSNAKMTGLQPARPIFETTEPMPRSAFADMRAKCASTRVNDDTCPTAGAAILSPVDPRAAKGWPLRDLHFSATAFLWTRHMSHPPTMPAHAQLPRNVRQCGLSSLGTVMCRPCMVVSIHAYTRCMSPSRTGSPSFLQSTRPPPCPAEARESLYDRRHESLVL